MYQIEDDKRLLVVLLTCILSLHRLLGTDTVFSCAKKQSSDPARREICELHLYQIEPSTVFFFSHYLEQTFIEKRCMNKSSSYSTKVHTADLMCTVTTGLSACTIFNIYGA